MAAQQFTNGYALIIAVDQNLMPGYALPSVAKDAAALHAVLVHPDRCAYPRENVRVLTGSDASRDGIRRGLSWLKARIAADRSGQATAIIYYSGHGGYDRDSRTYFFLPFDVRLPVSDTALRASAVAAEIESVRPQRLLVILDCCHAGGMGIKGEDLFAGAGLVKAAAPVEVRSDVALAQGQGRAVLSSSTADQNSYVRQDRTMSIFTYHLVEALTGHAQPADGRSNVLVSDLMGYLTDRVPRSAREDYGVDQTPTYQMSGENFPIALLLGGQGLNKGRPAPDALSVQAWPKAEGAPAGNGGTAAVPFVRGDSVGSSKFVLSGNFQGAVLNIESQLSNVTQSIMAAPVDGAGKADLNSLVASLQAELECVPADRQAEAEGVLRRVRQLTAELDDAELAEMTGRSLECAADQLADARPGIPAIARQISEAVRRLARG